MFPAVDVRDSGSASDPPLAVRLHCASQPLGPAFAARLIRWELLPAAWLLLAAAALPLDLALAAWVRAGGVPDPVRDALGHGETFGHGLGVVAIACAVFFLDPRRRAVLPRILWGAFGAGIAADLIKLCISRHRPRGLQTLTGSVFDTFDGWFPAVTSSSMLHGFPSAHTAVGVGLAVMLSHYYPRGRRFFFVLAALVALQRVACGAHFPSDVCVGAAVGSLFANMTLHLPRWCNVFPALEERLGARA